MHPYLHASDLTCRYGRRTAIDGINLHINQGEVVALLGSNGAGKSTTLRILAGLQTPSTGSVLIDGQELLKSPKRLQHLIGYVPDDPTLCKGLQVRDFLIHCARLRGIKAAAAARQVDEFMQLCDLGHVHNRLIQHLSMGLRQRVGLAQALLHKPALLILDEPTTGLDPAQVIHFREIINQFRATTATLLSTHQLAEVELMADRVQILSNGKCIFSDSLKNVQSQQAIRLRFAEPFDSQLLDSLDTIDSVQSKQANELLVYAQNTDETLQALLHMANVQNWPLLEIHRQQTSLEALYIEKTGAH